jgi:hypothetical protein
MSLAYMSVKMLIIVLYTAFGSGNRQGKLHSIMLRKEKGWRGRKGFKKRKSR